MSKNRFTKFNNMPTATTSKRVAAYFIDFFIMVILGILLVGFVSFPILKSSDDFKKSSDALYGTASELYDIEVEAKLAKKVEGEDVTLITTRDLFEIYFNQQVLLSMEKEPQSFVDVEITISSEYEKATYDNDLLGYYFTKFKAENNILVSDYGTYTPEAYFVEKIIRESVVKDLYVYNGDALPYIKGDVCIDVYNHLQDSKNKSTHFTTLVDAFSAINSKGLHELFSYDEFDALYQVYNVHFNKLCNMENLALLICYIVIFLLYFLLPQLIIGNGWTLGRFIKKMRIVYLNKTRSLIFNILCFFILFIGAMFFVNMFTFGFTIFTASLGAFKPIYIILLSLIIAFIDLGFMSFRKDKISIPELVSTSICVDVRNFVEEEKEETPSLPTNE